MSDIFRDLAPRYWAAGIPTIPLWPKSKRPALLEWSVFAYRMPTEEEQQHWLAQHVGGNIGLPLGPASGLVAFDIDSTDPTIVETIEELMPVKSPWKRVGAKGYVALFKYQGEKTGRIKDMEGKTICEILSAGTQVVLPPSIHPDTKLPYTANCDLLDVIKELPTLPTDFERTLRAALGYKGVKLSVSGYSKITEFVPRSSRDTKYTSVCGMYARDVVTGKIKLLEAIQAVQEWPATFTEQVEGDNLDPQDGVRKLIRFILRSVRDQGMVLRQGWDQGLSDEDKASLGIDFSAEEQEWPFEQIVAVMRQDLESCTTEADKMKVVNQTLQRLVRSPSLGRIQEEGVMRAILHESGIKATVVSLRKEIQRMRNRGLAGESHAEIAEHMLEDIRQTSDIRFDLGRFWEWEGSQWIEKPDNELEAYVVANYSNLPVCKRDSDYKAVVKTFKTLVTKPLAAVQVDGVNFSNGFLRPDLVLVEHASDYGMTYRMPYRYVPEKAGASPRFFQFLKDAWGDDEDADEKLAFLQEALCATLFGIAPKMAKAVLLYGVAHSGKSVLLKIIEGLFPSELVAAVNPDRWEDNYSKAQLAGKMLNVAGELHERKKIDGKSFKEIVDGSTIEARFMYQGFFKFYSRAAHWFASNYLPTSDDLSEGFLRRWGILTFNKKFPEEKRNVNLADDIIAEEREAIVAWAVQAMERLQGMNTYTVPKSHETCIRELLQSQDTIVNFIHASQRVQILSPVKAGETGNSKLTVTPANRVLEEYQNFTASSGVRPVSPTRFFARMKELSTQMGFKVTMQTLGNGFQEVGYDGLTVVGVNGRM